VFSSFSTNLVPDDTNEGSDIFVRDRVLATTTRISVYSGGVEGDGDAFRPSISADGRYVAFDADMWNLVWGDTNDVFDIFVHDSADNTTSRVSVDDAGTQANGASQRPALSSDGRYVSFESEASNLVAGDTNGSSDVFAHDTQSGATARVSIDNGGAEGNNDSLRSAISADGRFVAFESQASNLVAGDTNRFTDVFLRDTTAVATPPPPAPPVRCRVPRVVGLRLATARSRIHKANCTVGRVRRARSLRRVGRVLGQSPRAGKRLARAAKVNLVVGRR
jgi:Tol biopolymer transport system component